jgi:hypothetical protein
MTTISSASASSFLRSLHGGDTGSGGVYNTYTQDLYRYQLLYDNVITQLNQFIGYFSIGEFNTLVDKFTVGQYNTLILKSANSNFYTTDIDNLVGFEYDPTKFSSMRKTTYNVIDGLEQAMTLAKENLTCQANILELNYYKDILSDPKKLIAYIEQQKLNTMVFQASEVFQAEIKLKPWFQQYLQIHGPPGNGVFKSDLLAQIVIDLINTGVITENEFINS